MKSFTSARALGFAMLVFFTGTPCVASPVEARKLIAYGQRYVQSADDRMATVCFTRAVIADPSNMSARRLLAQCQLRAGMAKSAEDIMLMCVRFEPSADNLSCLGDARFALGHIEQARAAYTQALVNQPMHQGATLGLINVCVATQQYENAKQLCRASLSKCKDQNFYDALKNRLAEIEEYGKPPERQDG